MTVECEKINEYLSEIERLRVEAGKQENVRLLLATKTVDAERINRVTRESGITLIGENRVQELIGKYPELDKNLDIHFIGSLQKNKVKYIADKVSMIESLDSLSLAKEIDKQAKKIGKVMDVLVEVNIGREENKGGIYPEQLEAFLDEISEFSNISVKGIMTIAPKCEKNQEIIKYFKETYNLFIDILTKKLHNIDVPILSMGMTGSYREAISEGSSLVRIGSGVFGERK